MSTTASLSIDEVAGMSADNDRDGSEGSEGNPSQWWLDPALARLAFGRSTHASRTWRAPPDSESPFADTRDRRLRIDLGNPLQREFGDYELLELIGQGGMGVVYRARQHGLDREVAIKLLSAGQSASDELVESLRREAQHTALLQHPNIVVVHEMGEHDGLIFYAMQLVRGCSLSQQLDAQGPMPQREAARLLRTVAEAVDYAHRLGVLHLDLKPGNLLIEADGAPRIADFGLARRLEQALDERHVSGTPSYMAPEQARPGAAALTPAADVWALGAVLYEMLTGHPPFEGVDPTHTLRLLQEGTVRRPSRQAPVPVDLEAICLHCLCKDPAQRYPSARALADDLGRFLEGRMVSVRPLTTAQRILHWSRREPKLAVAASIVLVSLLTGVLGTSLQARRAERNADAARQQLWQQRIEEAAGAIQEHDPLDALPPMIQNLSEQEASGARDAAELSRVRIGALLAHAPALVDVISTGDTIEAIALDPAGKWVATASVSGSVRSFDLATGRQRWQTDTRAATQSWLHNVLVSLDASDDGKFLVASGHNRPEAPSAYAAPQLLLDAETGAMHMPPADRFPDLINATFSPDGRYAIVRTGDQRSTSGIQSTVVRTTGWQAAGPAMPESLPVALLAPNAGSIALGLEENSVVEILAPQDLHVRHRYRRNGPLTSWRFSNNGRQLVLGYGDGQVVLFDVDSGKISPLVPQLGGQVRFLHFSVEGGWLAASANDGSIAVWDLATGALVTDRLQLQGNLTSFMTQAAGSEAPRVFVDRAQHSLFAVNSNRAMQWRLPDKQGPATAQMQRPAYPRQMRKNASAMLPRLGLMVVGSSDGALRLWRSRERQPLPGSGPPMDSGEANTVRDGQQAIVVAGDMATVLDAATGKAIGPAIRYPQGVGYATLSPDGATLVATAGPRLYAHDPRSGRQRFAPIALEGNPNAFLMSPRGDQFVLGHNGHEKGHNVEVIESYASATGQRTGRVALWPPERLLDFSGDGATVLAWHVQVLDALDARTLHPLFPALWPDAPATVSGQPAAQHEIKTEGSFLSHMWVEAMASGDDGHSAWLLSGGKQNILQPMDATRGRIEPGWQLPSVGENLHWLPGGRVAVTLPEIDQVKLYERNGRHRNLSIPGINGYAGLALSGDGTRLAVTINQGVQVFDARSGDWLSPPIRVADAADEIFGLAVDPHGQHILLRSRGQRIWNLVLETERRPLEDLKQLASMLRPDDTASIDAYAPALNARTRAMLHAQDPGPPRPQAVVATATRTIRAGDPIADGARGRMQPIDLSPWCNLDLATSQRHIAGELRLDRVFSPGRQRLLGIDYDVRCAIIASTLEGPEPKARPLPARVAGIAVGHMRVATLHLLMTSGAQLDGRKAAPIAVFELSYRDGSRARLPILYRKQLWEWWTDSNEGGSRLAFLAFSSLNSTPSTYPPSFFEVRLQNPHPGREIASVALEAMEHAKAQPVLLALTVEPATGGPDVARLHPRPLKPSLRGQDASMRATSLDDHQPAHARRQPRGKFAARL